MWTVLLTHFLPNLVRVFLEEDAVAYARRLAVVHDAVAQPTGARADQRRAWRLEGRWYVSSS